MATQLAIRCTAAGLGAAQSRCARQPPSPMLGDRLPTVPIGAGDPATAVAGPAAFVAIAPPHYRRTRYGVIDALVTFAIMFWLAASLATLASEWGSDSSPSPTHAAAPITPSSEPHVAIAPAAVGCAARTSI